MAEASPDAPYVPARNLPARLARRLTQWRAAMPIANDPPRAIISFTFDDFARSAADTGAEIVEEAGARACFYACTGMAGTRTVCGEMFTADDIAALQQAGHDIGAHTSTHLDCARADPADALADIEANLAELAQMGLEGEVSQIAYPFGETCHALKQALIGRFSAARGVLAGINMRGNDLMQLRAVEIDSDAASTARAIAAIETAVRRRGWLILFTHDVTETSGPWGIRPQDFRAIVRAARDSGANLLAPAAALAEIRRATS